MQHGLTKPYRSFCASGDTDFKYISLRRDMHGLYTYRAAKHALEPDLMAI